MADTAPARSHLHDALDVFLGRWHATGLSYGKPDQDPDDPKGDPDAWRSTHEAHWHTGEFFLVQDERARLGEGDGTAFDTLNIFGVDDATGAYFARTFDNNGFERRYALTREGATWTLAGDTERATIVFNEQGRRQTITWEWKVDGAWRPLCDRVAEKT